MDSAKIDQTECRRRKLIRETELYLLNPDNASWARVHAQNQPASHMLQRRFALTRTARAA